MKFIYAQKPWEFDADLDTDRSFHAFIIYRDLPASERSLAKTAEVLGKSGSLSTLKKWCASGSWVERVESYSRELDRQKRKQLQDEIVTSKKRVAQIGRLIQAKVIVYRLRCMSMQYRLNVSYIEL